MESTKCVFLNYYSLYKSHNKPIWIKQITLLYPEYKMGCEKFTVIVTKHIRTINASCSFLHKNTGIKAARDEHMLFFLLRSPL